MTTEQNEIKSAEWRKKNLSKNSSLANVVRSTFMFKQYRRKQIAELRPIEQSDLEQFEQHKMLVAHKTTDNWIPVSISDADLKAGSTPHPEEILTSEQIQNALSWYDEHKNHVNSLVNGVSKFPPSLNEDKRDCRLWKPQHWHWFLGYYH